MSGLSGQFLRWSLRFKARRSSSSPPATPVNAPVNEHNGGYCFLPHGAEGHALRMNGHASQSSDQSDEQE